MTEVIINKCNEDGTDRIVKLLDEKSALKNGLVIISLLELEQLLGFCPHSTPEERHLKETMIDSYSIVVHQIYTGENWENDYLNDQKMAYDAIISTTYQ